MNPEWLEWGRVLQRGLHSGRRNSNLLNPESLEWGRDLQRGLHSGRRNSNLMNPEWLEWGRVLQRGLNSGRRNSNLMNPESLEWGRVLHRVWGGQQDTLDHTGKVTQVEQVVGLHGSGQEVEHGFLVHHQRAGHDLIHARLEFAAEAPVNRKWRCQYENGTLLSPFGLTQYSCEQRTPQTAETDISSRITSFLKLSSSHGLSTENGDASMRTEHCCRLSVSHNKVVSKVHPKQQKLTSTPKSHHLKLSPVHEKFWGFGPKTSQFHSVLL